MSFYEIVVPDWSNPNLEGEVVGTSVMIDRRNAKKYVEGFVIKELGKSFLVLTPKLRRARGVKYPVVYECDPTEEKPTAIRYVFRNRVLADKFIRGIKIREIKDERQDVQGMRSV